MSALKGEKGIAARRKLKDKCSKGNPCSFRHDECNRGKRTQSSSPAPRPQTQNVGKTFSIKKSPKSQRLQSFRTKIFKKKKKTRRNDLSGNCKNQSCDYWHPPACQNRKYESGCKFGDKCTFKHKEVENRPTKKPKKKGGKRSVGILKNSKQIGCFRMSSRGNTSPLYVTARNFWDRRAACNFQKGPSRHLKNRASKGPSQDVTKHSEPHEPGPMLQKSEDSSQ